MSDRETENNHEPSRRSPSGRNNRRSRRMPPRTDESAAIYVGGARYTGQLLDESNNGLGILLDDYVEIRKGVRVRVTSRRQCLTAVVVRCTELDDGGIVIGLKT